MDIRSKLISPDGVEFLFIVYRDIRQVNNLPLMVIITVKDREIIWFPEKFIRDSGISLGDFMVLAHDLSGIAEDGDLFSKYIGSGLYHFEGDKPDNEYNMLRIKTSKIL